MTPTDTELLAQVVAELQKLNAKLERSSESALDTLSYQQAARWLGCEPDQVGRLVSKGHLKLAERAGRERRVFTDSVRAYQRGEHKNKRAPKAKNEKPQGTPLLSIKDLKL